MPSAPLCSLPCWLVWPVEVPIGKGKIDVSLGAFMEEASEWRLLPPAL